jgi:hypothetical protein
MLTRRPFFDVDIGLRGLGLTQFGEVLVGSHQHFNEPWPTLTRYSILAVLTESRFQCRCLPVILASRSDQVLASII